MIDRILTIFFTIGFGLGQIPMADHAHPGMTLAQRREHDSKPHIHLGRHSGRNAAGDNGHHHHDIPAHRHETQDHDGAVRTAAVATPRVVSSDLPPHWYDDALILRSTHVGAPANAATWETGATPDTNLDQLAARVGDVPTVTGRSRAGPPRPTVMDILRGSHTYLTLRHLRN